MRDYLEAEVPPRYRFETDFDEDDDKWAFAIEFNKRVGEKGWVGINWPEEYGGIGKPDIYRSIMMEEFGAVDAPLLNASATALPPGPSQVRDGGAEAQVHPRHHRVQDALGGGPDGAGLRLRLASLQTRAVRDGRRMDHQRPEDIHHLGPPGRCALPGPPEQTPTCRSTRASPSSASTEVARCLDAGDGEHGRRRQNHTYFDNVRVPMT